MTFVAGGRRVVVTGLGAVTPLGTDVPTYWRRLVAGESGVGPITLFDASALSVRIAGEVDDFDPSLVLDRKEVRRNDRTTQMALVSIREAMDDAGMPGRLEGAEAEGTGILMGSGLGGTNTLIEQIATARIEGPGKVSPFFIPMAIANMPAGVAGITFGAQGPNYSTTSACASAGHALPLAAIHFTAKSEASAGVKRYKAAAALFFRNIFWLMSRRFKSVSTDFAAWLDRSERLPMAFSGTGISIFFRSAFLAFNLVFNSRPAPDQKVSSTFRTTFPDRRSRSMAV